MRLSCNGCRVLRKGCSDDCTIRPCLQWIKSPEAQANATVFLAKFYGRAGLLNLVNAVPDHLCPAVFRSLLYEACGRIVNPIYGSVGLLWSGSWQLCQAAVEDVLRGVPIVPMASEPTAKASAPMPTPKFYDIRHIPKEHGATTELHKITRTRTHFKRSATTKPTSSPSLLANDPAIDFLCALSKHSASYAGGDNAEEESMFSLDTVEASHVSQTKPDKREYRAVEAEAKLELTLGFPPESYSTSGLERVASPATYEISEISGPGADASNVELALEP